jgi:hypothetical protein
MTRRRLVVATVLVLWVLLGPIGMAFNGCAMKGTSGAPCALTSCVTPSMFIQAPLPVTFVQAALFLSPPSILVKVPTPPPRSLFAAA